jgi:mannose-6-phosphate isomerase-like protein (cupin superfamily)
MSFRRVVTGHDSSGVSIIRADEQVPSVTAGGFSYDPMWATDVAAVVPNDGGIPNRPAFFPAPGGIRVLTWVAAPSGAIAPNATPEEIEAAAPGLLKHMESDDPGMHTTQTIDVDVVMRGEIWMEVDHGTEVHLTAGDVVIQNGTRHRWHNRTDTPAVVLSVIVGAEKPGVGQRALDAPQSAKKRDTRKAVEARGVKQRGAKAAKSKVAKRSAKSSKRSKK